MPSHSPLHVDVVGPPAFAAALTDATGESGTRLSATTVPLDALPEHLDGTDCLLVDRRTAGASWRAALERVADARPRVPVVVLVDDDAASTVAAAVEADAADWLPRSLCETRPDTVVDRIDGLAGRARPSRPDDPVERFDRATATHDPGTGRLRAANGALVDLLGYDRARLREEGLDALVAADSGIEPVAADAGATWEPTAHEWQVETATGDRRWLATDIWPGNDGDGPCIFAVSRDVTERKRREQRFRLVAENVDEIIYVANEDFSEVRYLNPAYEDVWGRPAEEVYADATAFVDAIDPRDREAFETEFARMREDIARGEAADSYEFEFRIRRPDGECRWISATGYPVETPVGEGLYVGIASDITERRELERTYRELFNKSSAAITLHDPETKEMVGVNDTMCDLLGYDRETLLDIGAVGISAAAEGYTEQRGAEIIDRIMAAGEPEEYEWVVEDAGGDRHVLLVTGTPVTINGQERFLSASQEITERKRREREIEEERQKYSALVEQSTDAVVVVRDGRYVFVNDRFCELTGYDEAELLSMPFQNVFTPASRELVRERYERRVAGESPPNQYDVEVETADGDRLTLELSVSQIRNEGEPATMANFRDVTERRRRERTIERLQTATERLQGAETADEVYRITVETARDVLGLPMTASWRHDPDAERLTYVDGTEPVAEMRAGTGPVSFAPGDTEYGVFERDEATTYDPSEYHDHNPLDAAIIVPLGDHGLLAAGDCSRGDYEPYRLDAAQVLAGHATTALNRVDRAEQLRESEHRLRAIVDRIDEAIFLAPAAELTAGDPAPDFVSSGYEAIWGQSLDGLHETYEEGFFGTLHPDDYDDYRAFIDRLVEAVSAGDADERYRQEYRIERPDGEVRWVRSEFYPTDWTDGVPRVVIVSRDVTAAKRRERTIESFHDATAELTTADTVVDAARMAVDAAADVFDLPATAVYRYDEATATLEPAATGPALPDAAALPALTDDDARAWDAFVSETMYRVADDAEPLGDVRPGEEAVLFPLGGNGLLAVCGSGVDTEAASIIAATLEAALNRLRGERRLESRRAELEAQTERARRLESITELTRRIEAAITGHSSRRGIQEAVCAELVDRDPFDAAWVAAADVGTDRLTPRATAGIDADAVERVLDGAAPGTDSAAAHPVAEAWETGEPRVVDDLVGSGRRREWQRRLLTFGAGSVCAVPLEYSGITYGVLVVVADDPGEFEDREVDVLSQLGTSIGYAIAAIERRRALESDDTLELEFRGSDAALPFARLARDTACRVRHERTVRRQDGSVSVYYTVRGDLPADVADVASSTLPGDVEVAARRDGEAVVERRGSSWFGAFVSEYGGVLRRGTATDGDVSLVVELPREADIRTIVDRFRVEFPALDLTAQRQHQETETTPGELHHRIERRLTDRQYEAIETAHAMGYFEWPRESSGEEVAETLGITQPTINKHLRLGERKVFDLLFGDDDTA